MGETFSGAPCARPSSSGRQPIAPRNQSSKQSSHADRSPTTPRENTGLAITGETSEINRHCHAAHAHSDPLTERNHLRKAGLSTSLRFTHHRNTQSRQKQTPLMQPVHKITPRADSNFDKPSLLTTQTNPLNTEASSTDKPKLKGNNPSPLFRELIQAQPTNHSGNPFTTL